MPQYANYDPTVAAPSPVLGWYDTGVHQNLPPASNLLELTPAQWAARLTGLWAVAASELVALPAARNTRADARAELLQSDTTMHQIAEAVSLGLTTWTTADVVTFVIWRRALRALVGGTSETVAIPARPSFPVGT